jgi:hypothetical protein
MVGIPLLASAQHRRRRTRDQACPKQSLKTRWSIRKLVHYTECARFSSLSGPANGSSHGLRPHTKRFAVGSVVEEYDPAAERQLKGTEVGVRHSAKDVMDATHPRDA